MAAEALVRWRHPQLGTLAAGSFLPAICRYGLEGDLPRMMLKASISAQARWRKQGFRVPVSINLPPHLLEQSDLPDELLALTPGPRRLARRVVFRTDGEQHHAARQRLLCRCLPAAHEGLRPGPG
ncbi:EAL domain-containing protein [Azotobacter sp. CWF10]